MTASITRPSRLFFHINRVYPYGYNYGSNKQQYFIQTKNHSQTNITFEYIKTFNLSKYQFMYMFYKNNVSFNLIIILSMLVKDMMIYQSNDGSFSDQWIFKMFKNRAKFKKKKWMLKAP